MPDLHARLLAEIERREGAWRSMPVRASRQESLAYLAALRGIVELHQYEVFADEPDEGFCRHDQRTAGVWPCPTIAAVAEGLGVTP